MTLTRDYSKNTIEDIRADAARLFPDVKVEMINASLTSETHPLYVHIELPHKNQVTDYLSETIPPPEAELLAEWEKLTRAYGLITKEIAQDPTRLVEVQVRLYCTVLATLIPRLTNKDEQQRAVLKILSMIRHSEPSAQFVLVRLTNIEADDEAVLGTAEIYISRFAGTPEGAIQH